MLKLALQQRKRHPMHRDKILPWASCAPFVENSRGVLIHRPRSAQTITIHKEPHMAVQLVPADQLSAGGLSERLEP